MEVLESGTSRVFAIQRAGMSIGRDPKSALALTSPSVSGAHAELFWQGDDLFIRDVGSSFGTRRDGREIKLPTLLRDGDELVLGGSAVLRVSIFGAGFGAPLSDLAELDDELVAAEAPTDPRPFGIDLLPVIESLFQAASDDDLAHRITAAARERFEPSRVALLELEGTGERYRALSVLSAPKADASFVSRTIVAEAARRGVAHYREGTRERPLMSIIRSGASTAVAAGIRPRDGRVRVLYMDSLHGSEPLTWGHALSLQLFAVHAAAAFDAVATRQILAEDQKRFEQLRRYFSPAVVEHILKGRLDVLERPQNIYATVLFADLVGYTKLSERLRAEPDRLLDLLNRWLDAGARAVLGRGGTLDKFIGDGVMAVFGAPLAVEGGELAAVRCALDMRESLEQTGRELGEELAITVGINSGDVLAGSVGSRRRLEYTVLGDTVNVASRLQGRASPGEILVGPKTAAALAAHVQLEDAGELPLKNHEAVKAHRVLGLRQ